MEPKIVSFQTDQEFFLWLKAQADKENRTLSNFIETALKAEKERRDTNG